jgi:hypothetical protein
VSAVALVRRLVHEKGEVNRYPLPG